MKTNHIGRRRFLKNLGAMSLGSSVFTLALPKGSWAASAAETAYRRATLTMGTMATITIFGEKAPKAREAVRDAFAEMRRINDLMSTHRRYSQLSRVNRLAGSETKAVDPRVIEVVRRAIQWGRQTGGMFDVTTLPLLRAWGFRQEYGDAPRSVEAALECTGYEQISIEGDRLGLERRGAAMDVGGIGKGYAVDRAVAILKNKWGVGRAIVEAGGDLYVLGRPDDAAGWKIGIGDPLDDNRCCASVELADRALATSGRSPEDHVRGGRVVTHLINPADGNPVDAHRSLTACAATATDADAASTTLFVSGKSAKKPDLDTADIAWLAIDGDSSADLEFKTTGGFPAFERI